MYCTHEGHACLVGIKKPGQSHFWLRPGFSARNFTIHS